MCSSDLGKVGLFAGLSENEKAEVAERLQYAPFARGDVITKQGNTAHWLYIMAFGDAEVLYEPPSGPPQVLALLRPGQFFGEMALMTGDARTATVVAKTDVECWRLDRGSFQQLLQTRPEIAEEVKRVIGARRGELERAREAFAGAVPFLKLMGIVAGGWQMGRAALAAERKLESGDRNFLEAKIATARFYADHVLVQAPALRNTVVNGAPGVMALSEDQFLAA